MSLTYRDIIEQGTFVELANRFGTEANARILLTGAGFVRGAIPPATDPESFWDAVCDRIEGGGLPGGFERLLERALQMYPENRVFRAALNSVTPPPANAPPNPTPPPNAKDMGNASPRGAYVRLVVSGWDDALELLDVARQSAVPLNHTADSVRLSFANGQGAFLSLDGWSIENAYRLRSALTREAQAEEREVNIVTAESDFDDYLIGQLFVEGPDQARFEITDIPASTTIGELAQGVINSEYDPQVFGNAPGARNKRTVAVDRVTTGGSAERMKPDQSLHAAKVQEGETLSVHPEAIAGIAPYIRQDALVRVKNQIMEYEASHRGFEVFVDAISRNFPTEYTLHIEATSFAPPPNADEQPDVVHEHEVFLQLPAEFPMQAPRAFWQTPIFHPNIEAHKGFVCLGILEENYRPGLDFGQLCQMLIDIAGYRSYSVQEGYNGDAQKWAISDAGQAAITAIGGESLTAQLVRQLPPKLLTILGDDDGKKLLEAWFGSERADELHRHFKVMRTPVLTIRRMQK